MTDLGLAGKLLEHACRALEREMREFTLGVSLRTFQEGGSAMDEDRIKDLQDNRPKTSVWSEPEPWQKFAGDLQMIQREAQEWGGVDPVVLARVKEEARLLNTGTRLAYQFREQLPEARVTPPTLEDLAQQADVLRNFTEMWTIYQVAWEQRHKGESWHPEIEEGPTLRSLRAGDRVVRDLYKVVQQDLDTIMGGQLLIVVPFMSGLYAAGFDLPTPYIISPRWGHNQVWTWLGYAHEVGHHVYRNVKGLSDELKVNVVMELWSQGEDYTVQRIWLHWVEEIFADLFGLLQIGLAFAQAQQCMLPYLPLRVVRRIKKEGLDAREGLLRAADETHPIPYLRALLAIQALRKLGLDTDTELLEKKWKMSFQEDGGVDTSKVFARVRGRDVELPADHMEKVGNTVLDVILNTRLYALAKRKLADPDVFHEPLDERKKGIEEARKAITNGVPSGDFEMRHLLAATQKSLEELWQQTEGKPSDEDIDDLNTRIINIMEAYQEPALPEL
jgi:hypothetical protein